VHKVTETQVDPHNYASKDTRARILLMRHPQTVANEQLRYLGQENEPLSELGLWQLARAIKGIIAFAPNAIISSPLERCRAIAEPAASSLGLEVEVDERLQELGFGLLEGLSYYEAIKQELSFPWGPTAHNWPIEGAESLEDFAARVRQAADGLKARCERVAILTHGGVIRALASYWLGVPPQNIWSMTVHNVESVVFSSDGDNLYLERHGLIPEWLSTDI
jgi:broad specificity phosphatase PhoE